ncbi:hypothetical protein BLNAU_4195 [Blattamonas nauphoetae]|uniref:Uncharacterized protein n=1 Tax=Blattamonas nauphoetae TaxID=2049346 RepID=A0ABQ9YAJ8_9EUKA|nr:hypothetical protein BLNAU_4195 [Blattamonas nauphoetae]
MDLSIDANSLAMQHTDLKQNTFGTMEFFRVVYSFSVPLGHELGHVLQFLESTFLANGKSPIVRTIEKAYMKRYGYLLNPLVYELVRRAEEILAKMTPPSRITPFEPANQGFDQCLRGGDPPDSSGQGQELGAQESTRRAPDSLNQLLHQTKRISQKSMTWKIKI